MSDYLDRLAAFASETCYENLSHEAVCAVKDVTLDTIGAILAGSKLAENSALARLVAERSGPPVSTIYGHPLRAEPMMATLVNATAGVALEVDEGNRFGGGHPAIHTVPGALAIAEEMGASGPQLIESILVGYEIGSRLGGASTLRRLVQSRGTWGIYSTAVAVAKLRGYSPVEVRAVINLAASLSPANTWRPCFDGKSVRNAYSGRSGLNGILATHLFECGFTGVDDGPSDVLTTILTDSFDPALVVRDLGGTYRIQQNYFKFYACCQISHAPLEAVLNATESLPVRPERIQSVEVSIAGPIPAEINAILKGMMEERLPDSVLGAKFNTPYALAAAVVRGGADVTSFLPEAFNDARIHEVMSKVHVTVDSSLAKNGGSDVRPLAKAVLRLDDGRVLEGASGPVVRGDYANRVSPSELLDKFHLLAGGAVGHSRAKAIAEVIGGLEKLSNIRELTALLGGD